MAGDPLSTAQQPLDVGDYRFDESGRPVKPEGLAAALVRLPTLQQQLAYIYARYTPVHQQFGLRWEWPRETLRNDAQRKNLPVERYDWLIAGYRWAWSGQVDGQLTVPIQIEYGTSVDKTLNRPTLITAVWGSVLRWAPPPRLKVIRAGRRLLFTARLDYNILPIPPEEQDIRDTVLDVTVDAVELRPL